MLRNYKELKVWEKSYQLCLEVYRITKGFPKMEIYGLISQMRRAALSIPSNIAEGYGRKSQLIGRRTKNFRFYENKTEEIPLGLPYPLLRRDTGLLRNLIGKLPG
jgi:hypothetical protein